jgi:hypothetical protein
VHSKGTYKHEISTADRMSDELGTDGERHLRWFFQLCMTFFPDFLKILSEGYKNRDESPFYLPSAPSMSPLYSIYRDRSSSAIILSQTVLKKCTLRPDALNT